MRSSRPRSLTGATLAADLSVSALLFQAQVLLDRLDEFTSSEYPAQTVAIADLLRLLAERAQTQLARLDESTTRGLTIDESLRACSLGSFVHALHSYLRYLQASDPLRSPPGVQQAISLLVSAHSKEVLNCGSSDINVLVRPQWTYNLKYIDLMHQLAPEGDLAYALDPDGLLSAHDVRIFIDKLWAKGNHAGRSVPRHIAVLSFAGLDRDDVLLYPLLAHELGHFLDFALEDTDKESTSSTADAHLPHTKEMSAADVVDIKAFREAILVCLREITADLLATRMTGLAYFFSFAEFFKTLTPWPGLLINPESGYPGFGLRLQLIWHELDANDAGIESTEALQRILARWKLSGKSRLQDYMRYWKNRVQSLQTTLPSSKGEELMQRTVLDAIPAIQRLVRQIIPASNAAKLPDDVEDMVQLLEDRIPPFQSPTRAQRQQRAFSSWSFHEILAAGWLYQIAIGEESERKLKEPALRYQEYRNTCLLLLKALELHDANTAIKEIQERNRQVDRVMKSGSRSRKLGRGVISGPSLRLALDHSDRLMRLVVCPDFGDGPIESASRDIHLGHWFRVSRRTSLATVDIAYAEERAAARRLGQTEAFVPADGNFILQPGDFALAASMEYIRLPPYVMAFVEGKSSLGRTGLLIATATQIAPGFKGCIVLELYNAGTVPVIVRPAMRIAQLIFVSIDRNVPSDWLYDGTYQVQIRP